jgi:hypothetical protein
MTRSSLVFVALAAAGVAAAGCRDTAPVASGAAQLHTHSMSTGPVALSSGAERDVAKLRAVTARFQRFEVAVAEGWSTKITECFENAQLGGMGFHYGNTAYIDGAVDVEQPELLLYEPQENGRMRLVAVEYIVPFSIRPRTAPPPQLYGQSFMPVDAFDIWALHVWHERHNPRGMFADWNPNVNCDNAP